MLWKQPGTLFIETSAEEHPKTMSSLPWGVEELSWDGSRLLGWEGTTWMQAVHENGVGYFPPPLLRGCNRGDVERGEAIPDPSMEEQAQGGPARAEADARACLKSSSQLRTFDERSQLGHCAGCPPAHLNHHGIDSIALHLHPVVCFVSGFPATLCT